MSRRPEPAELSAAREQLRARYEKHQAAAVAFFDAAGRLTKLRDEVDVVEAELRRHAATLADALGVDTAARVTGWSKGRLGEAQRTQRSRRESGPAMAAGDACSDAGARSQVNGDTAAAER